MENEILDCGHVPSETGKFGTGYGMDAQGKKYCYDCCAEMDKSDMDKSGKYTLYLTHNSTDGYKVTNWPGTLKYRVFDFKKSRHNFGGIRTDVWFFDHAGKKWHGYQIGNFTQICHVKRLK